MNTKAQETQINGYFWLANERCKITCIDSFGGIDHYGFIELRHNITGWIPAWVVNQLGTELTA